MANASPPGAQTERLEDLLDRWQTSLDLHARYAALDDARYWRVQPWPKHVRPQRWVIQLARKRILALKRLVAQRRNEGDRAAVEGIEIMGFLAGLVALTSAEGFIPLATHENERREALAVKPSSPAVKPTGAPPRMPAPAASAVKKREPGRPATARPVKAPSSVTQVEHVVIADAVRLLGWGKQWHELADMIGRLAERPAPSEIRRILRTYRDQIDAVARRRRE